MDFSDFDWAERLTLTLMSNVKFCATGPWICPCFPVPATQTKHDMPPAAPKHFGQTASYPGAAWDFRR